MTNWQPIETAPRDGTYIIVFCPVSGLIVQAKYREYRDNEWGFCCHRIRIDAPTHWMPLPDPPKE